MQGQYIYLKNKTNVDIIHIHTILFIEYHLHYKCTYHRILKIYTLTDTYLVRQNIKDIYSQLPHDCFIIPHKAFIINLMHVKQFNRQEIIMDNNQIIPLSQKRAAKVRKEFLRFLGLE